MAIMWYSDGVKTEDPAAGMKVIREERMSLLSMKREGKKERRK